MRTPTCLLLACLLPGWLVAQQDIPLCRPEERQVADGQKDELYRALTPVLVTASKSTVRVWLGTRSLAYGTVVADGRKILTKFSELGRNLAALRVETGDGAVRQVAVTGLYRDEDIAVLAIQGEPLTPVQWSHEEPKLGSFLTATKPNGQLVAFGVVSVLERNLRETDKAYIGVLGDYRFAGPGVKLQEVKPDSAAAAAGLQVGDVILRVNDRPISGMLELRSALTGIAPGTRLPIILRRGEEQLAVELVLGNRPDMPQFSDGRLQQMEKMGGPTSRVRNSFSKVIQTDMRLAPDQIGGPVVDLQGRVVGITMARADRTRSFVMPAAAVVKLLESQPLEPTAMPVRATEPRGAERAPRRELPPGIMPSDPDRRRRHLDDMQRLMDRMREELEQLERQNR